tara:strand:- start:12586 stop:12768 length:183 start_codon:yes stop_codon:yes gene_type:complete
MKDNEELIKIADEKDSDVKYEQGPKIRISLNKERKELDYFDINYRPPDYHLEEDIELFKI